VNDTPNLYACAIPGSAERLPGVTVHVRESHVVFIEKGAGLFLWICPEPECTFTFWYRPGMMIEPMPCACEHYRKTVNERCLSPMPS